MSQVDSATTPLDNRQTGCGCAKSVTLSRHFSLDVFVSLLLRLLLLSSRLSESGNFPPCPRWTPTTSILLLYIYGRGLSFNQTRKGRAELGKGLWRYRQRHNTLLLLLALLILSFVSGPASSCFGLSCVFFFFFFSSFRSDWLPRGSLAIHPTCPCGYRLPSQVIEPPNFFPPPPF